jgi:hypothetical protein
LREKRHSNAPGRGHCEANAGHAPWEMVCWGRGIVTWRRPGEIGALAQALLLKIEEKGVPTLESTFLIKKKGPGLRNAWFHVGGWVEKNLVAWRSPNFDFRWSLRELVAATSPVLFRSTWKYSSTSLWKSGMSDLKRCYTATSKFTNVAYSSTVPLLTSPWSSPKQIRFRKFWRSYLDQNLLRITNPVSDLTGDQYM